MITKFKGRAAKLYKSIEPLLIKIQEQLGLTLLDCLGTGHWGIVWRTIKPGFVVKISADPTEGPIWQMIMNERIDQHWSGIARCFSLYRIPEVIKYSAQGKAKDAWVIVREDITPYNPATNYGPSTKKAMVELLRSQHLARAHLKARRSYMKQSLFEGWMDAISELQTTEEGCDIADVMMEIYDRTGIMLADIHTGNIGYRLGWDSVSGKPISATRWVIFDPGHSKISVQPEVQRLLLNYGK